MVAGRPTMERYGSQYHVNDGAMSPRSMQSGLTKYGIETSHSAYQIDKQPPPLSPLDKAKMQWKRHKSRIEAEAERPPASASSQREQELRAEPSRSRSVSPERMPMYGDRARGDTRSFGLVGEPIEPVKLRPVPKSQRLVRRSKSNSRASRSSQSSQSSRYSRSSSRYSRSSRYIDARDDTGGRSRDEAAANADERDSGCSNLIEDFAVRASQSFEDISKSFEEAEKKHREAIDALSAEVRKSMPSPRAAETTGTEKVTLAASFASDNGNQPTSSSTSSAAFPAMGSIFCGMDALQGFCTPLLAKPETSVAGNSKKEVQEDETDKNELSKPSTGDVMSCAGRCAVADVIASENTFSLDGLAALSSDDEDGAISQGDQLLILRETFSNLSSSLPEVGWKINVDTNNRRLVQQRANAIGQDLKTTADGTYRVVILDDRKGSSNPPIKVAVVERDPALLSRCHFAGWDGKRSHFTVLTTAPKPNLDAGSRVLQKLKEVPGTLTFTNPLSPSSEYSKMPRWMQPEIASNYEGADAVLHLVIGPEPPVEAKDDTKGDEEAPDAVENDGDEEEMLKKIVSGWSALSFSDQEDDGDDDEEESYAPSTVGAVEDRLLRNFLGSADWYEEETGAAPAVESNPTKQVESLPASSVGGGGKPPLGPSPSSRPPIVHQRVNTASSRSSTGSFHRRSNSIGVFTGDQLTQIIDPKLEKNKPSQQNRSKTTMQKARAEANSSSKKTTKSKFRPPLPIPGRLRQMNSEKTPTKKSKRGIWRKRSIAEIPSATSSSVGSSALKRNADPVRRENSIILKPSSSFEPGLVHPPQDFLIKCPMFRRALRSMGYCGKRERPRLEGWVAFSKGNTLQTLGPIHSLCRDDLRYIVLTSSNRGTPTLHIMTSKKDSNEASIDGVEHLVLKKNMKIVCSDVTIGNRRCLRIVDRRNEKVIGTFMPILINEDFFTDGTKSCLVSDRRFAKIMTGLTEKSSSEESLPCPVDDGQVDAANHARFVLDCEMKRAL